MTNEIVLQEYSKFAQLGMKNITAEDIRPPVAFLVQGIKDKSELVDGAGTKCPDGSFFLKGVNEIFESKEVYFVWIKKDHYQAKEGSESGDKWDGSRMYRAVAVRADDLTPFAINFQKSSLGGLNDLLTAKSSKNLPLFVFKTELKSVLTTNKKGNDYFKSVVVIKGIEDDPEVLGKLLSMAQGFDNQADISLDETETIDNDLEEQVKDVFSVKQEEQSEKQETIITQRDDNEPPF